MARGPAREPGTGKALPPKTKAEPVRNPRNTDQAVPQTGKDGQAERDAAGVRSSGMHSKTQR